MDLTNEKNLILGDLKIPDEIKNEMTSDTVDNDREERSKAELNLFFSFDIVNSTKYKTLTGNWPIILKELLNYILKLVNRIQELNTCFLWRVIGDEIVFILPINNKNEITKAVDAIFEITQYITISLKNSNFYDIIEDQSIQCNDIFNLKTQDILSIKSTAWIAAINKKIESPYDNTYCDYISNTNDNPIRDFVGKDIDAGFRVKGYTQSKRLAVSFELAYLLMKYKKTNNLYLIDYTKLKGVWNDELYPVIWYYDGNIVTQCQKELLGKSEENGFRDSFYYNDIENNIFVKNYFNRQGNEKNKYCTLTPKMYESEYALKKIASDRNIEQKINYLESLCKNDITRQNNNINYGPLKLHCVVVCCNVTDRKLLIIKRGSEHSSNLHRWEFGCAKANGTTSLKTTVIDYYKNNFGIDIELCLDNARQDKQPIPIAVYELENSYMVKKGIIFIAKILNKNIEQTFRPNNSHTEIKLVSQEELNQILPEEAVNDFHVTANDVFNNFNKYFEKEELLI